jgi:iron complex transport system ATP-binding protein
VTALLAVEGLFWSARHRPVLRDVTIAPTGGVIGLLGPNGCGKSSLLRCLAGLRTPDRGRVLLDGAPAHAGGRRDIARRIALLEQESTPDAELRVAEVVHLGRAPHRARFGAPSRRDADVVDAAMARTGIAHLADRHWSTLSGGERQRGRLARAFAQEPRCLLLDEPTNHLDVRHQLELLQSLADSRRTCVVALHDLRFAMRWCDDVVVLDGGRVVGQGAPSAVLQPDLIDAVWGVRAVRTRTADGIDGLELLGPTDLAR